MVRVFSILVVVELALEINHGPDAVAQKWNSYSSSVARFRVKNEPRVT